VKICAAHSVQNCFILDNSNRGENMCSSSVQNCFILDDNLYWCCMRREKEYTFPHVNMSCVLDQGIFNYLKTTRLVRSQLLYSCKKSPCCEARSLLTKFLWILTHLHICSNSESNYKSHAMAAVYTQEEWGNQYLLLFQQRETTPSPPLKQNFARERHEQLALQ